MPTRQPPRNARARASSPPEPAPQLKLLARAIAELFGTFLLVFAGVGTALFSSTFPTAANPLGVGYLGVALAFGLAVVAGAYAVGHISGAYFNPAITIGMAFARRLEWRAVPAYLIAQLVGAVAAASLLAAVAADGRPGYFAKLHDAGFASNGYGDHSPGHFGLLSVVIAEVVLTAVFVFVALGATDERAPAGFGPLAIGLSLTVIHLISIPISNTSVNPARSIATAIWGGAPALAQLWVFILVPLVAAVFAGLTYRPLFAAIHDTKA